MSKDFVHLNLHSEFSLIDSTIRIKALIAKAKAFDMTSVALADRMNIFALVKFYKAAIASGIKPIIGAELVVKIPKHKKPIKVIAYCKDKTGYLNLTDLISRAHLQGQDDFAEPVINWDWLQDMASGLIIIAGKSSDIGLSLAAGDAEAASISAKLWQQVFGDNLYLELQRIAIGQDEEYIAAAVDLASELEIPVVASNAVRFLQTDECAAHEARVCISAGVTLIDSRRPEIYTEQQYFRSPEEMAELFADIPSAITNAEQIAKRASLQIELGKHYLPSFPVPGNTSESEYLRLQSEAGLDKRWPLIVKGSKDAKRAAYMQRLNRELTVICDMGFPGYFLIVADFIEWAKNNGVPVGPGRGSGAGSLVAYVLGITEIDPILYELLFERFLNPERVSLPDFDIDFCMEGRDRVIEYVASHYGKDCVSQIITYGTMAARAVVRDVGRIMSLPYGFVDKIAKLIPFEIGMTLTKALKDSQDLLELYNEEDDVRNLLDLALRLEGLTRNAGKHAGGVVIAPTKLTDFTALYSEANSTQAVTQFDKDDIEEAGLVKFDFLGLRTLTIIDWAVRDINKKRANTNEPQLDILAIDLDDARVYDMMKRCETLAVFQLESRGMRDLIRRLQPDCFAEVIALVALFRPGPLQSGMVDDFIDRKHGRQQVSYLHPMMEQTLDPTYGVMLYQEQVMQIAQVLAGYSLGGADLLRRAMGKKKPAEMNKQRSIFITGAAKNNINETLANKIFDLIDKFSGYGFNKSHSAAYALLSYQTSWLKCHYPAEFMAAVLSSDMDNTDKVVQMVEECARMGLTILSPDVNSSKYKFSVNAAGEIVFGLGAVKGVGQATIEAMVATRAEQGKFSDLLDLTRRVDRRTLSRRALEPLVRCGACDQLGEHRAATFNSIDRALKLAEQASRDSATGQANLFDNLLAATEKDIESDFKMQSATPWVMSQVLQGEKDTLGFYISGHPLQAHMTELEQWSPKSIASLAAEIGNKCLVAGIVQSVRHIITKRGKKMAVIVLEDKTGKLEVAIFPKLYPEVSDQLVADKVLLIKGEVGNDDFSGGVRLAADRLTSIESLRRRYAKSIRLSVSSKAEVDKLLIELPRITAPFKPGSCGLVVQYTSDGAQAEFKLGSDWTIEPDSSLLEQLESLCGDQTVTVDYS